jgi:hypothetical protein
VFSTASDPSSDLDLTGFKGCTVNRFTATNPPLGDGDAGLVSFSGWNTEDTIAVNKTNGSFSAGPMGTNNPINCSRLPPLMKYACFFGSGLNTDGGVGAAGALTGNVIFPIMPQRRQCLSTGTNLTAAPNWPYPTCIERGPIAVQPPAVGEVCPPYMGSAASVAVFACEQSPINPLGVAQITEKLSGGADFAATMGKIGNGGGLDGGPTQFPGPLYIVKVTSGTTDITAMGPDLLTGGNGLSFTDGAIDTTQALTITFSCDPNNLTKAAACTNNTLAALLIQTDTGKRSALAGGLPSGVGQCIAKPPLGEITVSAAQMQALIGTQTGGSIQLGLANLGLAFGSSSSHTLVFTAGMGAFGFTNQ